MLEAGLLELPRYEMVFFVAALISYAAAAGIGVVQLWRGRERLGRHMGPAVGAGVVFGAVVLVLRGIEIGAVPLTGLFESMLMLTVVFGGIYLVFSRGIKEAWFGSAAAWIIFGVGVLAAIAARPAAEPERIAGTPWAIAHGAAMGLAGAAIMLAAAGAGLYLVAVRGLKGKKVRHVLGKMPSVEKLARLNLVGLKVCFVLITVGVVSGFGMAAAEAARGEVSFAEWLTDAKVVLVLAVWVMLAGIFAARRMGGLRMKARAYITIAAFAVILFAAVGTAVFCGTRHDFNRTEAAAEEAR
jgi:ABC-type transport system involved in cytochrome c biogenesis permease subunit